MGSSPLTRGKLWPVPEGSAPAGLIPAHAGKTGSSAPCRRTSPAHPRSRGENLLEVESHHLDEGSSPLTRGKHRDAHPRRRQEGLIPAHAGKTESARP